MPESRGPKVLLYDVENAPSLGYHWTRWQTDIVKVKQDWYLFCFAYKWLGERCIRTVSQLDFPQRYAKDRTDDYGVAKALWDLFNEADVVVAHNGNRSDQTKARTRFVVHGLGSTTPFREVDTLLIARRQFNFISNSLDDLCRQLGIGGKLANGGFSTTEGCMEGDPVAWKKMLRYNKRDVQMLEALYLELRPFASANQHPNMALIGDKPDACPKCGSTKPLKSKGWRYANVTKRRVFRCLENGCVVYGRKVEKSPVTYTI